MNLRVEAILGRLSDCGPEARFILEVVARSSSIGRGEGAHYRSKLLAKQLHMTEGTVNTALRELVAAGVVERLESAVTGKGRPTISYKIAQQSLAAMESQQSTHVFHPAHLQLLFSGADIPAEVLGVQSSPPGKRVTVTKHGKPAPPGARNRLSVCNRLLLGVLLASADQFGVVRCLSKLRLRQLTSLDSESLSHRLRRLRGMGLIRSYVPGVTSSIFRTKKINSTYFLNLNHPGYGLDDVGAVLVHLLPQFKIQNEAFDVLCLDVSAFRKSYNLIQPETPKAILGFLVKEPRQVLNILRLAIYHCASELLSRHWWDLSSDSKADYGWLRDRFEALLIPPADNGGEDVEHARTWQEVISYFCRLVVVIAKAYRSRVGMANWIGFDSVQMCILPVFQREGDEVFTLLIQPRPIGSSRCTLLGEKSRGELDLKEWAAEVDMPLEFRFGCGLLTPPARRLLKR